MCFFALSGLLLGLSAANSGILRILQHSQVLKCAFFALSGLLLGLSAANSGILRILQHSQVQNVLFRLVRASIEVICCC
jgi:hypothetical protein